MTLDQDHSHWTMLLSDYVHDGHVDFRRWAADGRGDLSLYLYSLSSVCHADYRTWNRDQQLAFWINAYNASAIALVLDRGPFAHSESGVSSRFSVARQRFVVSKWSRRGSLSLRDIKRLLWREARADPRVESAMGCAEPGCPAPRPEAYRAASLDSQLDTAAAATPRDSMIRLERSRHSPAGDRASVPTPQEADHDRPENYCTSLARRSDSRHIAAVAGPC